MSIIHDALKKVQQGLNPKTETIEVISSTASQMSSPFIDEILSAGKDSASADKKRMIKNKIKSTLIATCTVLVTLAIIIASAQYIYQQCKKDVPKVQVLAQKSFYNLVQKNIPGFNKAKTPAPKPLAQLTINSASSASITLNVHGIMSNATGNLALINDQVYQEGDMVDGAKIIKINLDSITVDINGTTKTIPVSN